MRFQILTLFNFKKLIFIMFLSLNTYKFSAQTTTIPDQNFEQALIDLNIDSDGVVNGQVLTADISSITVLDFSNLYIDNYNGEEIVDFTGIQDFTSIEILNLSNISINLPYEQSGIFNTNFNLREFIADDFCDDCGPSTIIPYLDLSNLTNLELISLYNNSGDTIINLSNPNITLENLIIDLSHDNWDPGYNRLVCINVADSQSAAANQFPYNTWNIITPQPDANGYSYVVYNFSSTCTLSNLSFEALSNLKVYPNPIQDKVWFDIPNQLNINQAELYNISGRLVDSFSSVNDYLDVGNLETGVYFLKLFTENSSKTFKIIKQ